MSANDRKIISIILEQSAVIEERCAGYKEEIINVIADILQYEREHRTSHMNIQQRINDKLNATAHFLADHGGSSLSDEGTES